MPPGCSPQRIFSSSENRGVSHGEGVLDERLDLPETHRQRNRVGLLRYVVHEALRGLPRALDGVLAAPQLEVEHAAGGEAAVGGGHLAARQVVCGKFGRPG